MKIKILIILFLEFLTFLLDLKYLQVLFKQHIIQFGFFGLHVIAPNSMKASTKSSFLFVIKSCFLFFSINLSKSISFSLILIWYMIWKIIENKNHQIATDRKEYKIPSVWESKLKKEGYKYIETFIKNKIPPPRYPRAYPIEET